MNVELRDLFCEVRDSGGDLVLRCTDPDGTERDIVAVPMSGHGGPQWVQTWEGHDHAHALTAEAVENRLTASEPDVRILPKRRSQFPVLRGGES